MKDLFVSYEIALKLKTIRYDGYCLAVYLNDKKIYLNNLQCADREIINNEKYTICQAPLYQQAIDWLDKTHNIHISRQWYNDKITQPRWTYHIDDVYSGSDINKAIEDAINLINT